MKVVALCGRAGSGKDSVADLMVAAGWTKRGLADALKRLVGQLFAFTVETLWGPSPFRDAVDPRGADPAYWHAVWGRFASTPVREAVAALTPKPEAYVALGRMVATLAEAPDRFSARHVLQQVGTEWGRAQDARLWLDALLRTISGPTVVTDARFANELYVLATECDATTVWIDATARIGARPEGAHASEPTLDDLRELITLKFDNNGTKESLPARVADLLRIVG